MGRNGCQKIVIINGHGGNTALIQYFAQTQLESPKDYVVYTLSALGVPQGTAGTAPVASRSRWPRRRGRSLQPDGGAGPEIARPERSPTESGADLNRLELPEGVYTGIWWYAKFPNHYQGNSAGATAARGQGNHRRDRGADRQCAPRDQAGRDGFATSEGVLRASREAQALDLFVRDLRRDARLTDLEERLRSTRRAPDPSIAIRRRLVLEFNHECVVIAVWLHPERLRPDIPDAGNLRGHVFDAVESLLLRRRPRHPLSIG